MPGMLIQAWQDKQNVYVTFQNEHKTNISCFGMNCLYTFSFLDCVCGLLQLWNRSRTSGRFWTDSSFQ